MGLESKSSTVVPPEYKIKGELDFVKVVEENWCIKLLRGYHDELGDKAIGVEITNEFGKTYRYLRTDFIVELNPKKLKEIKNELMSDSFMINNDFQAILDYIDYLVKNRIYEDVDFLENSITSISTNIDAKEKYEVIKQYVIDNRLAFPIRNSNEAYDKEYCEGVIMETRDTVAIRCGSLADILGISNKNKLGSVTDALISEGYLLPQGNNKRKKIMLSPKTKSEHVYMFIFDPIWIEEISGEGGV